LPSFAKRDLADLPLQLLDALKRTKTATHLHDDSPN
jgi:hypothetical protein